MLVLLVFLAALIQTPTVGHQQQTPSDQKTSPASQSPSPETKPSAVVGNPEPGDKQGSTEKQAAWWPPPAAWDIYWPTLALVIVTGVAVYAAVSTLGAINSQVQEMKATGIQTEELISESIRQSSAMEDVAKEIAISAKAARDSVDALKERTAMQMRAYLTVLIDGAVYQDKGINAKFGGSPLLVNTGHTPAHKIRFSAKAEVFPFPLPNGFNFPEVPEPDQGTSTLGPQQKGSLGATVDNFLDNADIPDIKAAKGKCLYVWGVVDYEDVFKEPQRTKFCQALYWLPDGKIWGIYIAGQNEAT